MTRGYFHQQQDEKDIKKLMDDEPTMTRPIAEMSIRMRWISQLAEAHQAKKYIARGDGYTPDDDDWHEAIRTAFKAKNWTRPTHNDPQMENFLIKNGF